MIASAKHMLIRAAEAGYCVGAFNCTSIAQLLGVVDSAEQNKSPVIIQTSLAPYKFYGKDVLVGIYRAVASESSVPICLHLDHCEDVATCKAAAQAGYTNIMIDASHHDFEENVRLTKEVCDFCHDLGDISVEGELGTVGGVEDQVVVVEDEAQLCPPGKSLEYVERTGVDLFAPAIGTAHGVYVTENPKIDFERFEQIQRIVNQPAIRTPLVVHGGTGLKEEVVRRLVSLGGAKFNVSTDLKHVLLDTTYEHLSTGLREYNPGKVDKAVRQAIAARVTHYMQLLGSTGRAV